MIRAKFRCTSITQHEGHQPIEVVKLCAANGSKESANAQWSKWTPSGTLEIGISNPDAQGKFKPGQHYFLDFSEAGNDE